MNADGAGPATVEVIRNYLTSAATEMQRTLVRTAYNTIIYEIFDFGISIYDADRRLVADSPGLALFLGANDAGLENGVEHVGEENLDPGDVVLLNYPYRSKAHTLDVLMFAPVFDDQETELIGYTTCRAHWLDLGAKDSGYVLDSTDVHQEGLIFPGTKVYKGGHPNEEIFDLIRYNSRIPDKVIGDLNAQIAALRTGQDRIKDLYKKYGADVVDEAIDEILDHGERTAREAVRELPDGEWHANGYADAAGADIDRIEIMADVIIDGEEFTVDLSRSEDQLDRPFNSTDGETLGKLCFKTVTTPEEDSNHGLYEPLEVRTREGSIFEPTYPAPTFVGWMGIVGIDVIYKALAKGMPDQIPASSGGDLCDVMFYGQSPDTGRHFVEANNEGVGWGATPDHDGANALMHISETMVRNIPIEVLERKAPVEFDRLKLRQDSGGAGERRGGLGIRRDFRVTNPVGALSIIQNTRTDGWGLAGGHPGVKNAVLLQHLDDDWTDRIEVFTDNSDLYDAEDDERWVGMMRGEFQPGEVISNRSGGGGGYGDPSDRGPEKVREDVLDEYISRKAAREEYGVVLTEPDRIDHEETARLRNQ
ncbi:hydantoinase B/oxoprolinase family protein [Halorussus salinisoli]|uniref:hydantoinase B/oxoprolinase family protein n=1 Tax=Halorussus salinisoli TaxID=2558242 RepID=UPI0010C16007|nr:hydantoinase B/oxoprolinase family protein [Halorussus salinisoli]